MSGLIAPVSLPALSKASRAGQFVDHVRRMGYVGPCVRDAFSWVPPVVPAVPNAIQTVIQAALLAGLMPSEVSDKDLLQLDGVGQTGVKKFRKWLARGGPASEVQRDTGPSSPDSERCNQCVFQEPPWSQGHAGCSHSWLNDRDGGCEAFLDRSLLLEQRPGYARFCRKEIPAGWAMDLFPDVFPGWLMWDELPETTCNLPSHYIARLGLLEWYRDGGASSLYWAVERERLRRFAQWANDEAARESELPAHQMGLPGL